MVFNPTDYFHLPIGAKKVKPLRNKWHFFAGKMQKVSVYLIPDCIAWKVSVFGVVWHVFSHIRIEYGELLRISLHSVQMREIRARKNPNTNTLHAVMAIRHVFRILSLISDEVFLKKEITLKFQSLAIAEILKICRGYLYLPQHFLKLSCQQFMSRSSE